MVGPVVGLLALMLVLSRVSSANAQGAEGEASNEQAKASADAPKASDKKAAFSLGGYVEAYWQWNFNKPENHITNYRGFDNRHNTITLSNLALEARLDARDLFGKIILQVGHTPSTYYADEPTYRGSAGANRTDANLWKYVQQAHVGYRATERKLKPQLEAGVFLSPIGPEHMAVYHNWNWSRSNLFFGLPFYHTGAQGTISPVDHWTLMAALYNGWNSVVDNNDEKSFALQAAFQSQQTQLAVLYFGGVERATNAPEGSPWRSTFDLSLTWNGSGRFSVLSEANSGFERNRFGTDWWVASQLGVRVSIFKKLLLAARGDIFYEDVPSNAQGTASPIFFPASWVSSGTGTLEFVPADHLSLRFEYRHDQAKSDMYFLGQVQTMPPNGYMPDARHQNTLTLGATAWF